MRALGLAALLTTSLLGACAVADTSGGDDTIDGPADGYGLSADPLLMPKSVVTYIQQHKWGDMHLQWHTERRWNLLPAASKAWAEKKGWTKATLQEGQKGNGLEFLAMHRMMMQHLTDLYPTTKKYFVGWTTPPTDPRDVHDPLPHGATDEFDPDMKAAIEKLEANIGSFTSDDDLGLYIETSLRPTSSNPSARSRDKSTGVHNYVHNRFNDDKSSINIGDPTVNLQNKRFWRLHGWIDHVWTEYRAAKKLTDQDPVYDAAMRKAMADMPQDSKGLGDPLSDPVPQELIDTLLSE